MDFGIASRRRRADADRDRRGRRHARLHGARAGGGRVRRPRGRRLLARADAVRGLGGGEPGRARDPGADRAPDRRAVPSLGELRPDLPAAARRRDRRLPRGRSRHRALARPAPPACSSRTAPELDDECAVPAPDGVELADPGAARCRAIAALVAAARGLAALAGPAGLARRRARGGAAPAAGPGPGLAPALLAVPSVAGDPARRAVGSARRPPRRSIALAGARTRERAILGGARVQRVPARRDQDRGSGSRLGHRPAAHRGWESSASARWTTSSCPCSSRRRCSASPSSPRRAARARIPARGRTRRWRLIGAMIWSRPWPRRSRPSATAPRARERDPGAWRRGHRRGARGGRAAARRPATPQPLASAQPALHGSGHVTALLGFRPDAAAPGALPARDRASQESRRSASCGTSKQRIEGLVEGVFSRAFSSQVQPVEIARKLAKEMDAHQTTSVSRVYVPNQYTVWLSTEDRERLEGYERSLEQELSAYLLEHARRHDYALLTRPEVKLETDDRLRLGEFGIQTRLVKPPQRQGEAPSQGEQGHTMVYSVPPKQQKRHAAPSRGRAPDRDEGDRLARRPPLRPRRAGRVLGRSRECDCVFADPNISRKHAELRARLVRRLADRRSRLDQRGQGQRPPGRPARASRPATRSPSAPPASPSTSSTEMDTEPIAVALKFGFLAVLYLFLLWVARSALQGAPRDRGARARGDRLPPRSARGAAAPSTDAWLVVVKGGGLERRRAARPLRRALDRPRGRRRRADRGPVRLGHPLRVSTRAGPLLR